MGKAPVSAIGQIKFAMNLARHGKVPLPFPPHVAENVDEARALRKITQTQDRQGARGHVQGERALARIEHTDSGGARRDVPESTPGETPPQAEG